MSDRPHRRWSPPTLTRRRALGLGAAAVASAVVAPAPGSTEGLVTAGRVGPTPRRASVADAIRPDIRPRADWAGDLGVTGELVPEDDVRFLLVHHTASTNDYGPDDVVDQIRGFYEFHTGPEKGWPDVAYNFFVDRYGGIWEARAGSIAGPVRGDATGGSQGFALLCSLIGNHLEAPATPEAQASMVQLLAWLGESYGIDTQPGATVSFTSRGSSLWPAGAEVTARTISGHRDMSTTTCPGDFVYDLIADDLPRAVTAIRTDAGGAATTTTTEPTDTTSSAPTAPDDTGDTTPSSPPPPSASGSDTSAGGDLADQAGAEVDVGVAEPDDRSPALIATGIVATVVAAAGAAYTRLRNRTPS